MYRIIYISIEACQISAQKHKQEQLTLFRMSRNQLRFEQLELSLFFNSQCKRSDHFCPLAN